MTERERLSDHKSVAVAIPIDLHERLVALARELGCEPGEALRRAIVEGLVALRAKPTRLW